MIQELTMTMIMWSFSSKDILLFRELTLSIWGILILLFGWDTQHRFNFYLLFLNFWTFESYVLEENTDEDDSKFENMDNYFLQ